MKQLRVDEVKTDRDVDAAEPLQGLTTAFKHPLLVLEDGTLIDGLRRLRTARDAGLEYVPVIVASDFVKATEYLAKLHENQPCAPRRAWEIMSLLEPLSRAWAYERRVYNARITNKEGRGLAPKGSRRKPVGTRTMLRKAVGLSYDQLSERIRQLYRKAEAGDLQAIELTKRVDSGELTPGVAHDIYTGAKRLLGDVRERSEQKTLLETGPQRLASVMQSLTRLGSPIKTDPALLEKAIESLSESRTQLVILINRLRKELPE